MRVTYVGRHDAVELDSGQRCGRGDTVEVPAEVGKRLLEQKSNWQPVKESATKKEGRESDFST